MYHASCITLSWWIYGAWTTKSFDNTHRKMISIELIGNDYSIIHHCFSFNFYAMRFSSLRRRLSRTWFMCLTKLFFWLARRSTSRPFCFSFTCQRSRTLGSLTLTIFHRAKGLVRKNHAGEEFFSVFTSFSLSTLLLVIIDRLQELPTCCRRSPYPTRPRAPNLEAKWEGDVVWRKEQHLVQCLCSSAVDRNRPPQNRVEQQWAMQVVCPVDLLAHLGLIVCYHFLFIVNIVLAVVVSFLFVIILLFFIIILGV